MRADRRAHLEDAVILPNAEIREDARLRRVVVDGGTRIAADLAVGYDVEYDRARFHVTQNRVTLITPSMLGQ